MRRAFVREERNYIVDVAFQQSEQQAPANRDHLADAGVRGKPKDAMQPARLRP